MFPSANRATTEYVRNREEKILRKRRAGLLVLFGVLLLTLGAGVTLAQGGGTATAQLEDADSNPVGDATFTEGPNGVTINANLQPGQNALGPGAHGVHIHETGNTSPDFEAAGEHFNPSGAQHGLENPEGPHAGDLEEIVVNEDGSAYYQTLTNRITLSGGENSILDSDGSALVIHAGSDDQETDPGGNSGGRAVAGVIRLAQTGEATTPESTTPAGKKDLPKSGGANVLLPAALGAISVVILGGGVLIRQLRRT
jgi:Cu-Zn family superoxide dismutase